MNDFEGGSGNVEKLPTEQVLLRNFNTLLQRAFRLAESIGDADMTDGRKRALGELFERIPEAQEAKDILAELLRNPVEGEEYARLQAEGARQSYGALEAAVRNAEEAFKEDKEPGSGPPAA